MLGGPIVVKVGGSLYDLPDLGPRLRAWLSALSGRGVLLVPGGGATANLVREFDRRHQLGEETSHWLALKALSLNALFLAALLPGSRVTADVADVKGPDPCVLDAYRFALDDEHRPGRLPHTWNVTSDSVAARAAVAAGASRLVLLKSASLPEGIDWTEAGRRGLVDPYFAEATDHEVTVEIVNFREWRA
jgi:aspartokinase-like uncharacterized kinase